MSASARNNDPKHIHTHRVDTNESLAILLCALIVDSVNEGKSGEAMSAEVSESIDFAAEYVIPKAAKDAKRILVKPNLGYPVKAPVTVSLEVLGVVLSLLREGNPSAEILIVEGVCSKVPFEDIVQKHGLHELLDDGMQLLDADTLPLTSFPNQATAPIRYESMLAPALLSEVDCRISVAAFKRTVLKETPLVSASLKNLYGLFPRAHYRARSPHSRGQLHRPSVPLILRDVYHCIGHLFEGAVVDGTQRYISPDWKPDRARAAVPFGKVIWGEGLLDVDHRACLEAGEPIPDYIEGLRE